MTNTMNKPYIMKVKDVGNRLKALNCFLSLMPHDGEKDTAFKDTDLKALLLKSMPLSQQNAYFLKGTCISDDFQQMLSYVVQFQSITDKQTSMKVFSTSQSLDKKKKHKCICSNH